MTSTTFSMREFILLIARLHVWSRAALSSAAVLSVVAALVEVIGMISLVPLVTLAMKGRPGFLSRGLGQAFDFAGLTSENARLMACLALFLVVLLIRCVIVTAREGAILRLQSGYTAYLQVRVMEGLSRAPWSRVEALQHARINQALSGNVPRAGAAAQMMLQIIGAILVVIMQWLLALFIAPAIAVFAVILCALASVAFVRSLRKAGEIGARINQHGISLAHISQQFLGGLKLAKAQNTQSDFTTEFEGVTQEVLEMRTGYSLHQIRIRQTITYVAAASAAIFLIVGKFAGIDAARLVASFAILTRISSAGTMLVTLVQQVSQSLPSHTSVVELLHDLDGVREAELLGEAPAPVAGIVPVGEAELVRFENVSYQTGPVPRVQGLSARICAGEVVALTGDSGAGKTTMLDLMTGLLEPTGGAIFVHGQPMDGRSSAAWRDRLSYVTQETWLSNDTIRANLVSSRTAIPDERLWWALEIAGAQLLVRASERGLETRVNEHGSRFSGGERQRLALARAILRQPEVLILDEATNAIDPAAEAAIFARLFAALPNLSLILIAHRPSTLSVCRRVIRMQGGQVAEDRVL
ncbi:MAG: ATP-binding cassette domain-containing protein [Novosphingobium sp.]